MTQVSCKALAIMMLGTVVLSTGFGATATLAQDSDACAPADGFEFICGLANLEQLISIEGTRWAVGSSTTGGAADLVPFYFLNLDSKEVTALDPASITLAEDASAYPGCPGPADFGNLQSLGIDYRDVGGRSTLFVVSHGGAFTIQVFELDLSTALPDVTWIGCVLPPDEHFWPDAVAALPDGGLLATSLYDPKDPDILGSLMSGKPYGALSEWHPETGWTELAPGVIGAPNGVILSPDDDVIYVAAWSGLGVHRIDRATGDSQFVDLAMSVDNLSWNSDYTKILAGGQTASIEKAFAECLPSPDLNCQLDFAIYEIDPQTLEKKVIVEPGMLGPMGAGTGALLDGDTLWVTSYRSDRIAYRSLAN